MVKAAKGWHPEGTAVLLGMYLALRREEIAKARWDRFDEFYTWYTVQGKFDATDTLPVHPVLRDQVSAVRLMVKGEWLFPGSRGRERVTEMTINVWTDKVAAAAGLGHVHPHQMRHTAIAMVNDETGDLRTAQVFARHKRLESTQIYTRTTKEKLERAMLLEALQDTGWNKSESARILGVSRRNLIRKVARFELEKFRED